VAIWLCGYAVFFGLPHLTLLYFPLVLIPLVLLILGLSWLLASLGVYLRDLSQIVGPIITLAMFLSPVFYPVNSLPEAYRKWLYLNPLTSIIEQMREVLFWGKEPNFVTLANSILISGLIAWLGFAWFQKTRKGFADVV
jgi:lipopolysaccharide transport system permease protein